MVIIRRLSRWVAEGGDQVEVAAESGDVVAYDVDTGYLAVLAQPNCTTCDPSAENPSLRA